jgi:hypothetical protein
MKSKPHTVASMAVALLCSVAQGVCAAPPVKDAAKPLIAAAARPTAVPRAVPPQSAAEINLAAAAARRDQDPGANGSVKDMKPASEP